MTTSETQFFQVWPRSSQDVRLRIQAPQARGLHVFRDIDQIEASQWDSILDPHDIQMSHRFIRACQEAGIENAAYWHLMLYDGHGLCCVASLCRIRASLDLLSTGLTRAIIRSVRRIRKAFLEIPILFCGLPVSFGQPCIKLRPGADVPAVLKSIAAAMKQWLRATEAVTHDLREHTTGDEVQYQPSGPFLAPTPRPVTCLAAWTYGWYSVRKFASLTRVMSNCRAAFSPQPFARQRLGNQIAMSATSPFSSPPALAHLRRHPLRAAPRNALLYHHLRRLAPAAARRNPKLHPAQRPLCNSHLHTRN